VVLQASDGRGGTALQTFTLAVIEEPPNRPPIFTSTPEVDAWINQLYQYDADAIDPDQDEPLTYSLILGPDGLTVHPDNGEVEWTPPPVLNLGDTVLGRTSIPGENGEFSFSGVAGQRIYFDPLQFSGNYWQWDFDVYSPSGEKLLDTDLRNNQILNLTESGNYQIVVDAADDHTGTYGFSAIDLGLVPIAPLDIAIEGSLSPGSEDDIYRFTGNAGQKLFFDQINKNGNLGWVLYDANNQVVSSHSSFGDMELYLPADGEYMLALQGQSGFTTTVDYAFEIITPEEITLPMSVGSNASPNSIFGEILEKGEEDIYTFVGTPGQRVYLDRLFQDTTAPWSHTATIISPSGQSILSHNFQYGNDPHPITLAEAGTYQVRLDASGEQLGSYSFNLLDLDLANAIDLDTVYSDRLDPGQETHLYELSGAAGQRLFLDSPGIAGATWTLYDSGNNLIHHANLTSDIEVVLDDTDIYTLAIQGVNGSVPVDYRFEVITPETLAAPLTVDSTITSDVSEKGEQNIYRFEGTQGQRLFLDTLINSSNTQATLVSPSGTKVINNVSLQLDGFRHPAILPEDGTYELIIDGVGESTEDYSLRLLAASDVVDLPVDVPIDGRLEPGTAIEFYQFNGNEGERLYFDTQRSTPGSAWQLYGPGNQVLGSAALNKDFELVLPGDGPYTLMLRGENSSPSDYRIQRIVTASPVTPLSLNSLVSSEIAKLGEQDVYSFEGTVGETLYFDARTGDSTLTVTIHNPSGNVVFNGNAASDSIPLNLTEAGSYRLTVDGQADATGDYSFVLANTAAAIDFVTPLDGTLSDRETILYQFEGTAGQHLELDSLLLAPGANWVLYAPNPTLANNQRIVGTAALSNDFNSVLPSDGTYILALQNASGSPVNYEIQINDISAAPVTNSGLGVVHSGTLSLAGEVDESSFTARAGTLIYFDGQGQDSNQQVRLYNPDGTLVFNSLDNRNDAGSYLLKQTGDYRLEVYGQSSNTTGDYQFQLLELQASPPLELNTQVDIPLAAGETKSYQFTSTVAQKLWLDGLNASNPGVTLKLLNASGRQIGSLSNLSSDLDLSTLEAEGPYYLVVQSNSAAATTASFQLLDKTGAVPLTLDTDFSGTFGPSKRETQLYTFTGTKDQQLYFQRSDGNFFNRYQLYGPDGGRVFSQNLDRDFELAALPTDGEYTLALVGTGQSNSNYGLRVVTPEPMETTFVIAETIAGDIAEAGQQNTYTFEGTANQRLFFDSLTGVAGISATLYSPSGVQVWGQAVDRDRNSTTLSETGTYRLVIDGHGPTTGNYSFRLLDFADASSSQVDTEISGDFGPSLRDAHLYHFTGTAGQTLYFDRTEGSFHNWYALYAADGEQQFVQRLDLDYEGTSTTLPIDGEYILVVAGNGNANSTYRLQMVTPEFVGESYSLGDTVSRDISEAGEQDTYTFEGTPGQQLWFDSLLASSSIFGTLVAPSGKAVWSQNLNSDRATVTLDEEGTYTFTVDGLNDIVGDYVFRFLDLDAATPTSLDKDIVGNFGDSKRETHIYRFTGNEGQQLYFDRKDGTSSNFYSLYNRHGQQLLSQHLNSDFEAAAAILPEDGEYILVFEGRNRSNNNYALELVTPDVVTAPLTIGATLNSDISEAGEQDIYTFAGTPGQQLWLDGLENAPSNLRVKVLDPEGNPLLDSGIDDQGLFTLVEAGTYKVVIDGLNDQTGDYSFRLLDKANATTLNLDASISGDFGPSQHQTQLYTFDGAAGQSLYLDRTNGGFHNFYSLHAPDGSLLLDRRFTSDDELELPQTGQYTLVVEGHADTNNTYDLNLVTPDFSTAPLTLGALVTGGIDEVGQRNTYTFEGNIGQQLFFDPLIGDDQINARLYDLHGTLIVDWRTDRNQAPVRLTTTGPYRLELDGSGDAIGDYRFRLLERDQAPTLALATPIAGDIDPGKSTNLYQFEGEPGQRLSFDLDANRWSGANWVLYGPGDTLIAAPSSGSPDFEVSLPTAGQYTLAIAGNSSDPVAYQFQVEDLTPASIPTTGLNTLFSGTLTPGDKLEHTFSAPAGTQILLDTLNPSINANALIRFNLLSPDGRVVLSNHDSRGDSPPLLLEQSGDYTVQIYGSSSNTSGDYALRLLELPADPTAETFNPLEPGSVTVGTLSPGTETVVYSFASKTGQQILFNGMEGNVNATLYDPTGKTVFSESNYRHLDTGPLTLNQDGLYHLAISGTQTPDRDYAFQLFNFDAGRTLPLNLPVSGHLPSGQQSELYKFTGTAGQTLFFDSRQGNSSNFWELYGPDGKTLHSTRLNTDFELELPADGDYTLLIEGSTSASPVDYEFQVFTHNEGTQFVVTPGNGETASNDDESLGLFPIQIEVSDNQGGTDIQDYQIRLWPDPDNANPIITSLPETRYGLNQEVYRYQLASHDPDGDTPTYRLVDAPLGSLIDANSGELLWFPEAAVAGESYDFTVDVSDGRGGFDRQSFSVDVHAALGKIQGAVFEDLNNNGYRDTDLIVGDQPDVLFVVDNSGSMGLPTLDWTDPNLTIENFDDNPVSNVDLQWTSVVALMEQVILQNRGTDTKIGIMVFGSGGLTDMEPDTPGFQPFTTPLADNDDDGIADYREAIQNPQAGGASAVGSSEAAIALGLADSLPDERTLNVIFMSDGFISVDPQAAAELQTHPKINTAAFAIGTGSSVETMQLLSPDASQIVEPEEVFNIFSGWDERHAVEPLMENVTVYLDLNENGQLDADEPQQRTQRDRSGSILGDTVFQFRFDNLLPGTYTLRQVVPPGFEETSPATGSYIDTITVDGGEIIGHLFGNHAIENKPNQAPAFTSTPPSEVLTIGEVLHYSAIAVDPDPNRLTYDLPLAPSGMSVDADTGDLIWVPKAGQVGNFDVILRVQDGEGGQDLQAFKVEIAPPNTLPTFTSIPPESASPQVGKPFQYQAVALDTDGDPLIYELLPDAPAGITLDPLTGLLLWTPLGEQVGQHQVTLKVTDDRGGEATQTLTLQAVAPLPNTAPTITSTPRTKTQLGNSYLYRLEVEDADGDPLSYQVSAPEGMTLDSEGLLVWTPTASQIGTHTIEVEVSDGQGGSDTQHYVLQVSSQAINRPPTITSVPATLTHLERLYQYPVQALDPDGDVLFWSLLQAPDGMVIDGETGSLNWQPTADQIGDHTVVIQATDALGETAVQEFTLQVNGTNAPPAIVSTPGTRGAVGQPYRYDVSATDPENDPLRFSLGVRPDGMAIDAATGLIAWTPSQAGSQTVEVLVEDSQGGSNRQLFTLEVGAEVLNRAPSITSTPLFLADTNQPYVYPVTAIDPDGDDLTFELIAAPAGVTIDAETGELTWTEPVLGNHQVVVGVTDGALGAAQGFTLTVQEDLAPVFDPTVVPPAEAVPDQLYRYDVQAFDPNGGPLTYRLDDTSADLGMTLDELGRLRWTPTDADVGNHSVTIEVVDAQGTTASQSFAIAVTADTEVPLVNLQVSNVFVTAEGFEADLGTAVSFQVLATDDVGVEDLQLFIDDEPVQLDANGIATVTLASVGTLTARAVATDVAGNRGEDTVAVLTLDTSDTVGPQVSLDISQIEDGVITAPTDILGTVTDDNLEFYTLSVAPVDGSAPFVEIARGTDEVTGDVLGEFDPTTLLNDSYVLRLTARDAGGNVSIAEEVVHVEGALKLGNFQLSFVDLEVPVAGIPITVARTYDSLAANRQDELGYGWRLEFRDTDLRTSIGPDEQYEVLGIPSKAFKEGTKVFVTLPGGERTSFTFEPEIDPRIEELLKKGAFIPESLIFYNPKFVAEDGSQLTLSVQNETLIRNRDTGEFYSVSGYAYNPAVSFFGGTYTLTTQAGLEYEIDGNSGDLISATDTNGNQLTFSDAGIISGSGVQVTFERDAQNRIVAVIDPAGNRIEYEYDAQGDLVAVTDREDNTTQFIYAAPDRPHFLTELIDPLGRTGARTEYDENGRLKRILDANGEAIELVYDPENSIHTVKDVFGNPTTYEYDERGNILTEIDAVGKITKRTYDEGNNILSETVISDRSDPEGYTTTYTYDSQGNQLSETDPLSNTTRYTYGAFGRLLSETDPLGNTTTYTYDGRGNILSSEDAAGQLTEYSYSPNGNLLFFKDAAGTVTRFSHDGVGNVTRVVDSLGNETTYTYDHSSNRLSETKTITTPAGEQVLGTQWIYDKEGRVLSVVDPNQAVIQYEYDANGNQTAVIDVAGRQTEYRYDSNGQLIETLYPDNTPEDSTDNFRTRSIYDSAGREIESIDEAGRSTYYKYDELGRLIETLYPDDTPADLTDNPSIRTEYYQTGEVKAEIDGQGNRTEYRYDERGLLVETIYPDKTLEDLSDNPRILVEYNAAKRPISETDALGYITEFLYDELGRLIETRFHNGTSTKTTYNTLGNIETTTDQENNTIVYRYDELGRLTGVKNALGDWTDYRYDNNGYLIEVEDVNGNITRYEYDELGRRIVTELPLGQRSETTYDVLGRTIATNDFNHETIAYTYDLQNRLAKTDFANDPANSFTYTPTGQVATITNGQGVTTFHYDEQDRLIARTDPNGPYIRPGGPSIEYEYDAADNRTAVHTPSGSVIYTYDEGNRLQTVTDFSNSLTAYQYDTVGNLVQTLFPNNIVERRSYDDLNRLIGLKTFHIEPSTGVETVITGYDYLLNAVGQRVQVQEANGRLVKYEYDDLYRLVREIISDPNDLVNNGRTIEYTYDKVVNRLTRNDSIEGLTTYVYDENDRLLEETLTREDNVVQTFSYRYDDNGNLITRIRNNEETTVYLWDDNNRLVEVQSPNGETIAYSYDADGIRVSKTVNNWTTNYLVDKNRPFAQVLEELHREELVASYVYGRDLISQDRNNEQTFYHVDGLGSTRALTDESGSAVGTYTYEAFGELIGSTGDSENNYLFAGEQFDETLGQYYLRERYYSAETGRFATRDPFEGSISDPISLHKYHYAHANPVNYTDPSGLFSIKEVLVALEIFDTLDTINDALTFAIDPSFGNLIVLLVGIIGFPPGLDKGFKAVFGKTSKSVKNGIESVVKNLQGSELLAKTFLESKGLKTLLSDNGLKNIYKKLGRQGKSVDIVLENQTTRKLVFTETKDALGESQLKEIFPDKGLDKFTNSIEAMKDVYAKGGSAYVGTDEVVITTTRIRWNQLHPWSITPNGILQKNGATVFVEGLPVKVQQL